MIKRAGPHSQNQKWNVQQIINKYVSCCLGTMWFVVLTQAPKSSITSRLTIHSELQLLQPNDICFAQQWLHLALLFVTAQPIFQSAVSKGRSGNIRTETSVSLISSSQENCTCLFPLKDVNSGRIPPSSACALDIIKTEQIFDRFRLSQSQLNELMIHDDANTRTDGWMFLKSSWKVSLQWVEKWRSDVPPQGMTTPCPVLRA